MKKILLYGTQNDAKPIRWHFGEAEYVDMNGRITEIAEIDADYVVVDVGNIGKEEMETIRTLQSNERLGKRYALVDDDDYHDWMSDMIDRRIEASRELAKGVTHQEWLEFELFDITAMGFDLTGKERREDFGANCLMGLNRNSGKSVYVIFGYGDYRQYDGLAEEKYLLYDEVHVLIDDFDSRRRMVEDLHDCGYIHDEDYKYQLSESLKHIKELADEKLGVFDAFYW